MAKSSKKKRKQRTPGRIASGGPRQIDGEGDEGRGGRRMKQAKRHHRSVDDEELE